MPLCWKRTGKVSRTLRHEVRSSSTLRRTTHQKSVLHTSWLSLRMGARPWSLTTQETRLSLWDKCFEQNMRRRTRDAGVPCARSGALYACQISRFSRFPQHQPLFFMGGSKPQARMPKNSTARDENGSDWGKWKLKTIQILIGTGLESPVRPAVLRHVITDAAIAHIFRAQIGFLRECCTCALQTRTSKAISGTLESRIQPAIFPHRIG